MTLRKIFLPLLAGFFPLLLTAQTNDKPVANWQNLDLKDDGVFGISTEKAYDLVKGKKNVPVIVAVIDGGVDIQHEDLRTSIWKNPKEIAGNGKDDDGNGYVDDVHGWNFIGGAKGDVQYDNLEVTRLIRGLKSKYEGVLPSTPLSDADRKEFQAYRRYMTDYLYRVENAQAGLQYFTTIKTYVDTIVARIGKPNPSLADFEQYNAKGNVEPKVLKIVKTELKKDPDYTKYYSDLLDAVKQYRDMETYHLNLAFNSRDTVGDRYENPSERRYGNADVTGPDALHGTHVAGIIGASRSNTLGIKGVANNVLLLSVRTVPNGDERDKDVANAIRYATENGAKVINMSFGKPFSPYKAMVDSAIRFAAAHDVLMVHAAGNDGLNTDLKKFYPNRNYGDTSGVTMGTVAPWIEVGASAWKDDDELVADFSNYGKKSVDVFAPGVKINSTVQNSKYKDEDGTSMAAPVVAGLAALIRSYYPALSAVQVKDIILKSVTPVNHKVKTPGGGKLDFSELCVSGGVVNAYAALQLASQTQPEPLATGK